MTLLFVDGFDYYPDDLADASVGLASRYTISSIASLSFVAGRFGGRALENNNTSASRAITRALGASHATLCAGMAMRPRVNTFGAEFVQILSFSNAVDSQMRVQYNTTGLGIIRLLRGSDVLATSDAGAFPLDVWSYLEMDVVFAPFPGGRAAVYVDGAAIFDLSGIATEVVAGGADSVEFRLTANTASGVDTEIDDIYIATEKPFLPGGARVQTLRPSADAGPNGWTAGAGGGNFAQVDETMVDGTGTTDVTYVEADAAGQLDFYEHAGTSFNPKTMAAVQIVSAARRNAGSPAADTALRHVLRLPALAGSPPLAAAEDTGEDHLLTDSYAWYADIFETDPQTGLEFDVDQLNALDFGIEARGVGSPETFDGIRATLVALEALMSVDASERSARLTQETVLSLDAAPAAARATQAAVLAMTAEDAEFARITQAPALIIIDQFKEARLSQTALLALVDVVDCATRWALCVKLTRSDGLVFAYTDFSTDLDFYGITYKHCPGLMASAYELSAMLGDIGNQEFLGIIDDIAITERDLYGGLFDDAAIEVWQVPWDNNMNEIPFRIMIGSTGNLSQGKKGFKLEITTPSARLQQQGLLEFYTPSCRFELGDDRCTIDLEALRVTGTVTAALPTLAPNAQSRRAFIDTGRVEADQYFEQGELVWTSGFNTGLKSDVKSFDATGKRLILWEPAIYRIEVGDEYSIVPGCDLTPETCKVKFDNYINFGGFDKVPGSDAIAQTPNAKQ